MARQGLHFIEGLLLFCFLAQDQNIFSEWKEYLKPQLIIQMLIFLNCCSSIAQLCLTLCNFMDCNTPGFRVFQSLLKLTSMMPFKHLILCAPFSSCLQSFLASGPFSVRQLFTSGGQSIGASASGLPMSIQDWFPLGLTALISLLSKGLSRVYSITTVQKHQFLSAQPS